MAHSHRTLGVVLVLCHLFQGGSPVLAGETRVQECVGPELDSALAISGQNASAAKFKALVEWVGKFKPRAPGSPLSGIQPSGLKVMMAALELGAIEGLKTTAGKPLNISAGGVSTVLTDLGHEYPKLLQSLNGGELVITGVLMDGISTDGMTQGRSLRVRVDGQDHEIATYEYQSPHGAKYIFLDHWLFKKFTVTPAHGESVYTMRGIEDSSPDHLFEQQKVWSALNQAIAQVYAFEKAQVYVPHDSHVSPASYYIHKQLGFEPISSKPLIHNERYLNSYYTGDGREDRTARIWNVSRSEMWEYFRHGDDLVMLAPALRIAEQKELFSGISVAEGTANALNRSGLDDGTYPRIELYSRIAGLTNFLGDDSRPQNSPLLEKASTEPEVLADGITDAALIERFVSRGFKYGQLGESEASMLQTMAEAKAGIQRNFGMTVDPTKPLFLSFARLVYQKGMKFALLNVEHILNMGGQVVIGGPVGDAVGAEEQTMALALKKRLTESGHPNAHNFHVIAGSVKGRLKGLLLAASDFFIISSRYEPCGLTDCEALFHGTIPVAHNVGGLNKGENTILYGPTHPDDQGLALGEGINQAFAEYRNQAVFKHKRIAAMREDFSARKHFALFMRLNRLELYGKMLRHLQAMVDQGKMTEINAEQEFKRSVLTPEVADLPELEKALKMISPHRQTPLMKWTLQTIAGSGITLNDSNATFPVAAKIEIKRNSMHAKTSEKRVVIGSPLHFVQNTDFDRNQFSRSDQYVIHFLPA